MKLRFYKILVISFCLFSEQKLFSQVHFEGNKIITPFFGFPNFGAINLKDYEINAVDAQLKTVGPLGIRGEFLISDKIGIGFDFIYNSYSIKYTRLTDYYDGNSNSWLINSTIVEKGMKRFRFQFRYNYHFESSNPNIDWYTSAGIGLNSKIFKNLENGQKAQSTTSSLSTDTTTSTNTVFPISARVSFGLNYYFTPKFAVGTEIGLGGPLVSASISYKLF